MKKPVKLFALAMTAAAAIVIATASPATASEPDAAQHIETPLEITGFDAQVAEANGFEIIEYEDGSWESVAVTEDAKKLNAETGLVGGEPGTASRGSVTGNCGTAWVDAWANGRTVTVQTGYNVSAPVANRIGWAVTLWTWSGAFTLNWPDGPSGASWYGQGGVNYGSATSGNAIAGGSVLLINGTLCGSGLPSDPF